MQEFHKGDIIFLEDSTLDWAGTVVFGEVHLTQENYQGNRSLLQILRRGELFGESFACGTIKKSRMIVSAGTDCEVLLMPLSRIQRQCTNACSFHHRLIENMNGLLANKNVRLMERTMALSQRTLREKIIVYLIHEKERCRLQQTAEAGSKNGWFTIPHSRTQMAEYLCADRTALSRELTLMKQQKLIDFNKNQFQIF